MPPHAANTLHPNQAYNPKDIKREPHSSVIVKRDVKPVVKMENPIQAHSHHNSPSSSSPRPQHPRPAHTPEHRPDRPQSSSTSPATGVHPHLLHHSSPVPSGPTHSQPPPHSSGFRSLDPHSSPRSQSPYKPTTSQPQAMPQPLNFCKSPSANKKSLEQQPQQMHPGYPASVAQAPVSLPSSIAYSYSLIQQGLVPNPIYSQVGGPHPSGPPPIQHNSSPLAPNTIPGPKTSQLSPSGNKRKSGGKDGNISSRKKPKGHPEMVGVSQPMSIPVTTPQILTNPSPYTTSSSSTCFTKPVLTSSLSGHSSYIDSFKSFVDNTVQTAFLQEEKKAQEKAERERQQAAALVSTQCNKVEPSLQDRKPDSHIQSLPNNTPEATASATRQDNTTSNVSDSYNSRIMDTINRVANNQVDTDSDTLSASSPPPQIKPTDTNSPLSKSGNNSGASHPHHMKKAWLQRHDEDKKSETPVPVQAEEDSSNSNHTRDIISCVENSPEGSLENRSASPANVVVTLPNGNVSDLNHHIDESTSSASESEMQVRIFYFSYF